MPKSKMFPPAIDDYMQVLYIMAEHWQGSSGSKGSIYPKGCADYQGPCIEMTSMSDRCSGGGGSERCPPQPITKEVLSELRDRGYVEGTPHMGYTDYNELQISKSGEAACWRWWGEQNEAMREKVRKKRWRALGIGVR